MISIEELSAKNFATKLATSNSRSSSLLVFMYSSNCAFCTMMTHHLLQISNILAPLRIAGHLQIMRIDGDKNDLPWPFTVAEYPSLMLVADGDSRLFTISESNSVALDKILGFTIANLRRPLRIYAIQLTCAASRKSVKSLRNCLMSLRNEIEDGIAASLKEWRRISSSRGMIVRRLQLLEEFYLETFRVSVENQCVDCDFDKLEVICRRIVKVWDGRGVEGRSSSRKSDRLSPVVA